MFYSVRFFHHWVITGQIYGALCPYVGPSVRWSVRLSARRSVGPSICPYITQIGCLIACWTNSTTSALSLTAVFTIFPAIFVDQCALFALHNNYQMILMIIKVYGAEIGVFMARLRGVTSGLSLSGDFCRFLAILVDRRTFFYHFIDLYMLKERG